MCENFKRVCRVLNDKNRNDILFNILRNIDECSNLTKLIYSIVITLISSENVENHRNIHHVPLNWLIIYPIQTQNNISYTTRLQYTLLNNLHVDDFLRIYQHPHPFVLYLELRSFLELFYTTIKPMYEYVTILLGLCLNNI